LLTEEKILIRILLLRCFVFGFSCPNSVSFLLSCSSHLVKQTNKQTKSCYPDKRRRTTEEKRNKRRTRSSNKLLTDNKKQIKGFERLKEKGREEKKLEGSVSKFLTRRHIKRRRSPHQAGAGREGIN